MKYRYTIERVYSLIPHTILESRRDAWVSQYLEGMRHFDALEEHLARLAAHDQS